VTPTWQDAAPETHCRHCGTRVYPTDARCMGCGRKLSSRAAEDADAAQAAVPEEQPPQPGSATEAAATAVGRASAGPAPAAAGATVGALASENTPAVHVDCPRPGCTGRVRVPTKMGGEGTTYCPLCRKAYEYVLGQLVAPPQCETLGRGVLRRWQLRYMPLDPHPQEATVTFMGPSELQVRVGDEFVFMHLREDPEQNVLRNATLGRDFRLQPPPGCFPAVAAVAAACWVVLLVQVMAR